jgi:hypothetical protein
MCREVHFFAVKWVVLHEWGKGSQLTPFPPRSTENSRDRSWMSGSLNRGNRCREALARLCNPAT